MTTATVNNIGNVDIKPTLTLKINTLNGETVFNNTDIDIIFPEDSSELTVEWPDTPTFGIYNLITSVNILGKNQIVEKIIFILPSWFILLSLLIIVAIIVAIVRYIKLRKTKRTRKKHQKDDSSYA